MVVARNENGCCWPVLEPPWIATRTPNTTNIVDVLLMSRVDTRVLDDGPAGPAHVQVVQKLDLSVNTPRVHDPPIRRLKFLFNLALPQSPYIFILRRLLTCRLDKISQTHILRRTLFQIRERQHGRKGTCSNKQQTMRLDTLSLRFSRLSKIASAPSAFGMDNPTETRILLCSACGG